MFARWQHPVWRAGYCFTKQIYESVLIFAISQKSLKIFWYFGLCRFNDNLITVSKTFSFSSRNWNISVTGSYNIYSLGKEDNSFHFNSSSFSGVSQLISLAQPPNQRCRQNYALILLPLLVGYPLSLNHLLSTQPLTVCFLPFSRLTISNWQVILTFFDEVKIAKSSCSENSKN